MAILSGTVTIGTEPTLICAMGAGGALLYPSGDGVHIGGPDVAASGDKMGVLLPPLVATWMPGAAPFELPVLGTVVDHALLYGVSGAGGQTVSFAAPQPRVV